MSRNLDVIKTADGSVTLYNKVLDEHYHSIHGSIRESLHVFIKHGLDFAWEELKDLRVLEIGLGTGLNALLTLNEAKKNNCNVHYSAIEAFPLTMEQIKQLNYLELLNLEVYQSYFELIHSSNGNAEVEMGENFKFIKRNERIEQFTTKEKFDVIYFDAFGPRVQPELWTFDVFEKMFGFLKQKGILVTYCAKGEVKRTLKKVGFELESLPGPPGKREMTRALKVNR